LFVFIAFLGGFVWGGVRWGRANIIDIYLYDCPMKNSPSECLCSGFGEGEDVLKSFAANTSQLVVGCDLIIYFFKNVYMELD